MPAKHEPAPPYSNDTIREARSIIGREVERMLDLFVETQDPKVRNELRRSIVRLVGGGQ